MKPRQVPWVVWFATQPVRRGRRSAVGGWWLVAVALCVGLWCSEAHADNAAAAEALFVAGRELSREGDVQGACQKFRESYRLDRASGTELNLAICEAELGHLAVAWELFRSLRSSLSPGDPRVELADRRLSELEPRLPRIVVAASVRMPPGLTVRAGSVALTESGFDVAIPIDPGEQVIVADAPGFASREYRIAIHEGEVYRLRLEPLVRLQRRPEGELSASPPEAPAARRATHLRTSAVISFGVAGAALTTSLAMGLAVLDRQQTMQAECAADGCSDAGMRAAENGEKLATASTLSFAASLAFAATGVVLLLFDAKHRASAPSLALAMSPGGVVLRAQVQ